VFLITIEYDQNRPIHLSQKPKKDINTPHNQPGEPMKSALKPLKYTGKTKKD